MNPFIGSNFGAVGVQKLCDSNIIVVVQTDKTEQRQNFANPLIFHLVNLAFPRMAFTQALKLPQQRNTDTKRTNN